jgi:hypothetical protein
MPVGVSYDPDATPKLAVVTFRVTSEGLEVPDLALPTGTWQVDWELEVAESITTTLEGVALPGSLPADVFLESSPAALSSSRWTATLRNERSETEGLSEFEYDIILDEALRLVKTNPEITKDPTIVVTTDPIGPPTV